MDDLRKTKKTRWGLERLHFFLDHIEDFIDDRSKNSSTVTFEPQRGIENLESLYTGDPEDPNIASTILERLTPFFEMGLLLELHSDKWVTTELFWRGQIFRFQPNELIEASAIVNELAPTKVGRKPAYQMLEALKLEFVTVPPSAQAYFFKPIPDTAYVLISDLPEPWSSEHVSATHRLLNKSFIF